MFINYYSRAHRHFGSESRLGFRPGSRNSLSELDSFLSMAQDSTIKNIRDLMLCNQEVKSLTENSLQIAELNHILATALPAKLAQFCSIGSYRNGALILEARTGSAATQLKFMQPQIFGKLKKSSKFRALQNINIRIAAPQPKLDRHYIRRAPVVSAQNRTLIRQTADTLSDQNLASSMRKLADTLENYGKN
ncbi:MAG: DciA family protein [Pseudomonadota bacterium]|nr:DciA family protein [Pseudomonadota bacterium]